MEAASRVPPTHSPLVNLPTELVEQIAAFFSRKDFKAFRLICKTLFAKSTDAFRDRFFHTVKHNLSIPRHKILTKFAHQHEYLRRHVKTLHVHRAMSCNTPLSLAHANRNSSMDAILSELQQLLAMLPNCKAIRIDNEEDPSDGHNTHLTASTAVVMMLCFIADTGLEINSFDVDFAFGGAPLQFPQERESPMCEWRLGHFNHVWSTSLKSLTVRATLTGQQSPETLSDLVTLAQNLSELRLETRPSMLSVQLVGRLQEAPRLPQLRRLVLDGVARLDAELWSDFLLRFKDSLTSLSLQRMQLPYQGGAWTRLIQTLITHFPLLDTFSFWWMMQYQHTSTVCLCFCPLRDDPYVPGSPIRKFELVESRFRDDACRVTGMRYHGPSMAAALERLIRSSYKAVIHEEAPNVV